MKKFSVTTIYIFLHSVFFAQISPGNISSDLRLWLRADLDSYTDLAATVSADDGDLVRWWSDQTTNNFDARISTDNNRPTYNEDGINFNPSLTFDGSLTGLRIPQATNDELYFRTGQYTMFFVFTPAAANTSNMGFLYTHQLCTSENFDVWYDPNTPHILHRLGGGSATVTATVTETGPGEPAFFSIQRDASNNIILTTHEASTSASNANDDLNGAGGTFNRWIGRRENCGGTNNFQGEISEIIAYDQYLDPTGDDYKQIQSYLAIRYGLSTSSQGGGENGDYLNSSAINVWDASFEPTFHHQVIGLSRDDVSGLNRRQTKTGDDSLVVYISNLAATNEANTGSFNSDEQYLMIGNNQASIRSEGSTEFPVGQSIVSRVEREWKVTNTGFDGNFSVKFTTLASTVTATDLRLLVDDDADLSDGTLFNPTFTFNAGEIIVSGLTDTEFPQGQTRFFTIVSVDEATILPVELLAFNAIQSDEEVDLFWSTATENNSDYFHVEHSLDGLEWTIIDKVQSAGISSTVLNYKSIDDRPAIGENLYRLKQVDQDGTFEYSSVRSVNFEKPNGGSAYPNPTNGIITLRFSRSANVLPLISNLMGKKLNNQVEVIEKSDRHLVLDVSNLRKGIYFIFLNGETTSFTKI